MTMAQDSYSLILDLCLESIRSRNKAEDDSASVEDKRGTIELIYREFRLSRGNICNPQRCHRQGHHNPL